MGETLVEVGFRGEEVDVPAASYKCVRNASCCDDGCGTTLPHLRLGIVQGCCSRCLGPSLLCFPLPTSSPRHFWLPALG